MSVNLCRRQTCVAEQLLDRAQVGAAVEEVGRGAVSQAVRADLGSAGQATGLAVDDVTDLTLPDPAPAHAEEERRSAVGPGEHGSPARSQACRARSAGSP